MGQSAKGKSSPEEEDYDARFQVADPGFSANQDKIHADAIEFLRRAIKKGQSWKAATAKLNVKDKQFKAVIMDDFLKITLAERHFQAGEEIKKVALALQVPEALLVAVKEDMIREVKDASVQVYHLSRPEGE